MKLPLKVRVFLIDTLTMTILTSVPAAIVEFYLLGLPAENVIGVRTFAGAISLATGGLYGRWRDYVVFRFAGEHGDRKKRMAADVLVNMSFTVLLYPLQLWLFEATRIQILQGLSIALLSCVIVGPCIGLVLEIARAGFRPHAVLKILRPSPRVARDKAV